MTDPRTIIANALFNYTLGKAGTSKEKTIRPWGIEHAEGRADAVLKALSESGWYLSQAGQSPRLDQRDKLAIHTQTQSTILSPKDSKDD